ncbi:hypothetical protein LJC60_10785 [Ruminococcaceae bacterium OttesenSCG-928-D13]|nr:hypothetical protein [Ruminococcaceae bacterium OttesenSCG-928-D13]
MKAKITHEAPTLTHIEWELQDVTPHMINWFWCNMEKGDNLWHPNEHHDFSWMEGYSVKDKNGFLGSIHIAPQTWGDGKDLNIYIRAERFGDVPDKLRAFIKYDHAIIAAGISMDGVDVDPAGPSLAWRLHQWQKSDGGVVGMSTGLTAEGYDVDSGPVWAAHNVEEIGNWEVFLPTLYRLFKVITRPDISPYQDFLLKGSGIDAQYATLT